MTNKMEMKKGKLIRWVDDKGFGFIKQENNQNDIFIHISALKVMSRKPVIGDIIHYEVGTDSNAKTRAINAKIEGVSQTLTLTPLKHKNTREKTFTANSKTKEIELPKHFNSANKRVYRNSKKSQLSSNFLPIIVAIGIAVFLYNKFSIDKNVIAQIQPQVQPIQVKPQAQVHPIERFHCEGKVWCSEMSSYAEAVFYIQNCPGTKMDGDGDGEPCERQFN